jgi:hypothetical protein
MSIYKSFIVCLIAIASAAGCRSSMKVSEDVMRQEPLAINKKDSTVIVAAGGNYEAGKLKRKLLGDHYRDVWTAPVKVPIINLKTEKGGLDILRRGGGMQTYSLKLEAADGKLFGFRSIQKDPSPVLPDILQSTIAEDIFQDQISASHPYGAFVLPELGDAAGIYHTNPELFYLPDTPELGEFQKEFGGMLVMLEEDADEDWSDYEDFGYTENAISSNSVMEDLRDDNDNEVDQRALLRARLFDMWIGDWDRHEGQWRWAEFEKEDEKGMIYRPIPEDRDNVFFKFDGILPWIASRKWAARKFQSFEKDVRDIAGLNFNARHFDRRFLTKMSREDWLAEADSLQRRLDDRIIEEAIRQWPDTVYALTGKEIEEKLKARKRKLKELAMRYYEILAREVDILGSDKHEYFVVERLDDDRTEVTVYKSNDDGEKEKVIYHRMFFTEETDEIRLYGFRNEDFFDISGDVRKGILVRVIGGGDADKITDKSRVRGLSDKTKVYDLIEDTELHLSSEARNFTSNSLEVNRYDYESFEYNLLAPQLFFGYNVDDGIYIGGGVLIETNNFRKFEYSTRQKIVANVAFQTGAYNFIYEGDFREAFRNLDLNVDLQVRAPNFISNYFGMGNASSRITEDDDFYRYRKDYVNFHPGLQMRFGDNFIKFGPVYNYNYVREQTDSFLSTEAADIPDNEFGKSELIGLEFMAELSSARDQYFPVNGIKWVTSTGWYQGISGEEKNFSRLQTDLSFYLRLWNSPITLAARIGGASNIGDFNFFQANNLGGNAGFSRPGNLRGFVRDRFSGRTTLYQNTELRLQLAKLKFYLLPMRIGILTFIDHGRVWSDSYDPDIWHRGYGAGIFLRPVDRWVLTTTYEISEEDRVVNVNLGFLF